MAKNVKFGTFGGVFVPSILTILGVIMYLRLPMIVGEAGLWYTLGIIAVAHLISVTTGLSVSSIATDKKVKAGGTYYMISRSLGLSIGGTLGLALFVGLSFSVSLYLIGFSESFLNYWGISTDINSIRLTGTIVLVAVTILTFISTSFAIKTQYFIMAAIGLSLLSIFFGKHEFAPSEEVITHTSTTVPLMVLFGIFFPAVTGFEAGVSMSGDLKDPKRSIPLGSIMAIAIGFLVYIGLTVFFALTVDSETLINDPKVLLNISWIPELVIVGIWGATLSSALGSILGAPRILQATATDKITPRLFARGYGLANEPRNALLLTFLIAETGILIGELDIIARIVSIFFITTYGFLNISAAFERWTGSDFRPEFKISGWISLTGAVACLIVMIQLDFMAMLGATAIMGLLFLYLKRKELSLDSGDAWSGVWASLVKTGLINLKREKIHKRNWRPNIIMFTGNPQNRRHLIEIGEAISGKIGILSGFELIKSNSDLFRREQSVLTDEKYSPEYFHHRIYCSNIYNGMDQVVRMYGFSGIEPNTILMGWSKNPGSKDQFIELLQTFKNYKYNTVFLNFDHTRKYGEHQTIDIWWEGRGRNLSMAINIIRHIKNSRLWKSAFVRLLIINPVNEEYENIFRYASSILMDCREDMDIKIVNNETDPLSTKEIIVSESKNTDLVIMGLADQRFHQLKDYYDEISATLDLTGSALVINASEDFEEMEAFDVNKQDILSIKDEKSFRELKMSPMVPSKYEEITADITKIEINGQKVLELFYKKTFQPIINDHLNILDELSERIKYMKRELDKTQEFPDLYRRRRALDKLKNDILFQINELFAHGLKEVSIPDQIERMYEGITWYENRLKEDYNRYPRTLKIRYQKEDFKIVKNDSLSSKIFKISKRIKHLIAGYPITNKVQYRKIARLYQLNNRQIFLKQLLSRFQEEDIRFYNDLRKITKSITSYLDEFERKIQQNHSKLNLTSKLNELNELIGNERKEQLSLLKFYSGRLQLEFRKNLQLMSNDLSKLNINSLIQRKSRSQKFYNKLQEEVTNFPFDHILRIKTLLNMILMELSLNSAENRLETLHEEFMDQLTNVVHQKLQRIVRTLKALQSTGKENYSLNKIKVDEEFEAELQEGFDETIEHMVSVMESMPETLEIYSLRNNQKGEEDTLSIPVARMAEYYFKSRYELVVEEKFHNLLEIIKRSIYKIKDILILTQFNIENTPPSEINSIQKEIMEECTDKIEKEVNQVHDQVRDHIDFAGNQFRETFDPLSSMKIEESANEYVTDLRTYQGKKVLSGVHKITGLVGNAFKSVVTRLFYSRSKGILLAQKFGRSQELGSTVSRLLDLKEKVGPDMEVMKVLPSFYTSLFNGRSNIGKDFWIPRPLEEKVFAKAIERYHDGFFGGILILGERNSGKTSFCKYVALKYLKSHPIYSVFPPIQGTISEEDFIQAVRKATQMEGDIDQIMNHVSKGSVLIINDLELFWERSQEGLNNIILLEKLIDSFSHKIIFIVNMNPHAFRLINQLTEFNDHFIDIINFTPFNAEELKELIMKRHQSSGLNINVNSSMIPLNELQMAQLFNGYFDYSMGNPGTALNGWLANIQQISDGSLNILKPENPSLLVIRDLDQDWTMILTQYLLHKRLTLEKLERITGWAHAELKSLLLAMLRAGIIVEKASGIYQIDPYIQPFITLAFKDKEILA